MKAINYKMKQLNSFICLREALEACKDSKYFFRLQKERQYDKNEILTYFVWEKPVPKPVSS